MTLEYLQKLFDMKDQLRKQQELIDSLWDAAHPGAQKLDGMPHSREPGDKVGNLAIEIAELETQMEKTKAACAELEPPVLQFLDSIDDVYIRTIFRLRFFHAMRWREVAVTVHTSEEAAKELCYAYLRRSNANG